MATKNTVFGAVVECQHLTVSKGTIVVESTDTGEVQQELDALDAEIQALTKRTAALRSRRMDRPINEMQSRLQVVNERLMELEPYVCEERQLANEADFLRTSIVSQSEALAHLRSAEERIALLVKRRQLTLRLASSTGALSGASFEAT